jgi:hypothetical protein
VGAVGAVLEHHRGVEQVVGVDHGALSEQLLDPAARRWSRSARSMGSWLRQSA